MAPVSGRAPFVGRQPEIATLRERLRAARLGTPGLVLIAGEPGVGKTRLVREFNRLASDDGWTTLYGRAYESEGAPPYIALAEALRDYVRACPAEALAQQLGDLAADVALVSREVARRLPQVIAGGSAAGGHDRFRLFESVADFLLNTASMAPAGLVLCLDDLHWADRATILLLQHLARRLSSANEPLLVVGAYRAHDLPADHALRELVADLSRERLMERVSLGALPVEDATDLVAALSSTPVAPAVIDSLYEGTQGNPFFIEEMVRQLRSEGRDLADSRALASQWQVPETVRQVVHQRLGRLGRDAHDLVQLAAILGDGFSLDVMESASEIGLARLTDALEETLATGILLEEDEGYHFSHALIRRALLDELSRPRRMLLHQRAAEAIERTYAANLDPHLDALAHHFGESGRASNDRTLEFAARAARRATSLFAYEDAATYYQRALQAIAVSAEPDRDRQLELLLALGDVQRRAGDLSAAMHSFELAADLARKQGASEGLARAALGYEETFLTTGTPRTGGIDRSIALLEAALAELGAAETGLRARVQAALAQAVHFVELADPGTRALKLGQQGVELARKVGDRKALAHALNSYRIVIWGPANLDERIAVTAELMQLASEVGEPELALEARFWHIAAVIERGDRQAADREINLYAREAEALRQPVFLWRAASWKALQALWEGRYGDAERQIAALREFGRRCESIDAECYFTAHTHALRRDQDSATQLDALEPTIRELAGQYAPATGWLCEQVLLYAALGRREDALRLFEPLAANNFEGITRDWLWLTSLTFLAEASVWLKDDRRAETLYSLLLPYGDRHTSDGSFCPRPVASTLGLLAAALGRWQEAEAQFDAAVAANIRFGARPSVVYTSYQYAAMLAERDWPGDRERGLQLVREALPEAKAMGMGRLEKLLVELTARLESGDARALGKSRSYPDRLSTREVEVLRLLAAGATNREIADALVLSIRTVERHIANLYAKIGVERRVEATAYALRHRLAEQPMGEGQRASR